MLKQLKLHKEICVLFITDHTNLQLWGNRQNKQKHRFWFSNNVLWRPKVPQHTQMDTTPPLLSLQGQDCAKFCIIALPQLGTMHNGCISSNFGNHWSRGIQEAKGKILWAHHWQLSRISNTSLFSSVRRCCSFLKSNAYALPWYCRPLWQEGLRVQISYCRKPQSVLYVFVYSIHNRLEALWRE